MVAAQRQFVTQEAYLATERAALEKSDYFEGQLYPMAGASFNHNRVCSNVNGRIINHLEQDAMCQSFSSDMRVHLPETTLYAYPDMVIVCGEPHWLDDKFDNLLNPAVLIEVLSAGTEDYDRGRKFQRYRRIPTLQEYVLIDSQRVEIEVWRKNEQGQWMLSAQPTSVAEDFTIGTVNLTISLQDVYARTVGLLI